MHDDRPLAEAPSPPAGIRPRTLWLAIFALVLLGSALIAWLLLREAPSATDRLTPFSAESTTTVSLAGRFPRPGEGSLSRPLGLAGDGEVIYVALGGQGAIAIFDYEGNREGTITIPPAPGRTVSSPVDIAIMNDGRLGVVDTAGSRVIIVDPERPRERPVEFASEEGTDAPVSPTAIARAGGAVYVADSSDHSVREYTINGTFRRRLEFDAPGLSFVGGLTATQDDVYVADSNAGRGVIVDRETARQTGTLSNQLELPRGIAINERGEIWVAEMFGRRILLFDPAGQTVLNVIGDGEDEDIPEGDMLQSPESILWDDETSRLYVSDTVSGCICVYNVRREVAE
ncbi:MAG: hypothetical protein CVT60_06190 [Actinobacteria bacterium HGW-Actinobacteria-10]|nr:MAG: hypothetical protein CVT60_06190 [Actinobacteria bacterium HGW-Actinobacteria-10]